MADYFWILVFLLNLVAFGFFGWCIWYLLGEEEQAPTSTYIGLVFGMILTGLLLGGIATEKFL